MKKSDFSLIFEYTFTYSCIIQMIKKQLIFLLLTTVLSVWLVRWASSGLIDFLNNLWENIEFGYITDTIDVDEITTQKVTFTSPFILDEAWNKITKYRLMYSPKSLDEMETDMNLRSWSMEKQFTITDTSSSTFKMDLTSTGDQVSSDKIYYVLVTPEASNWIFWEISNEMCFRLDTKIYWEWNDCINWNWTEWDSHDAWWADMSLANISHTKAGSTITLRWISLEWSDEVEIFLRDRDNEEYKLLWTADMNDEEYSFTSNKNGEHRVKFIPDNGGTEHIYTFSVLWSASPTPWGNEPGVTNVPKVGPKENIIAVLIFTFAVYFIYRRAKRNS